MVVNAIILSILHTYWTTVLGPILVNYDKIFVIFYHKFPNQLHYDEEQRDRFGQRDINMSEIALVAWHSGHRVGVQNRRSRVRIPPGCKEFIHCSADAITYIKCIIIVYT
jgi:hypothetical protein